MYNGQKGARPAVSSALNFAMILMSLHKTVYIWCDFK